MGETMTGKWAAKRGIIIMLRIGERQHTVEEHA